MINDKATASGAPTARSCDVCALPRGTPATLLQDGLCWGDGHNALLNEQCLRRGYEREKAAREALTHNYGQVCAAWTREMERRIILEGVLDSALAAHKHDSGDAFCWCLLLAEGTAARSAAPKGLLEEGEGK